LPHPSGVSRWLNEPVNVDAVDRAMTILRGWIEEMKPRA
jgi:uracil-DNA glycosylase